MCIAPNDQSRQEFVEFPNGNRRLADGRLQRPGQFPKTVGEFRPQSTDVPLGEGSVDAARTSILTRRERLAQALGEE